MESYTSINPKFSSSINIVETTDPVHADLVNAAPKQLLENILVLLGRLNEHLNDKNNPHNITAENINAIAKSALGVADGVAKLDKDGIVPVENGGTGGSSGITAANSLQVAALAGGAAIAEGTDLDTLTVPGTYAAANAAVAATLLHCPISASGFVMYTFLTYPYNGGTTYRTQIIICGADTPSSFWIRNFNGSKKWCDWVRMKYTDTTYSNMVGATASAAGKAGLVPTPAASAHKCVLYNNGIWLKPYVITHGVVPASTNAVTLPTLYSSSACDYFITVARCASISSGSFYASNTVCIYNVSTNMTAIAETSFGGSSLGTWFYSVSSSGSVTIRNQSSAVPWEYSVIAMPR